MWLKPHEVVSAESRLCRKGIRHTSLNVKGVSGCSFLPLGLSLPHADGEGNSSVWLVLSRKQNTSASPAAAALCKFIRKETQKDSEAKQVKTLLFCTF